MIGALIAKKVLAGAFDALNRHDVQKFMSVWHDDCMFIFPGEVPESGKFQGKNAVEGWFQHFCEQFPEINFEMQDICVRNIFDLVGNNVIAAHWNLKLTNREGRAGQNSGVTLVHIRHGKVILGQDFLFDVGENFRLNWGIK
jgi:ketosteroid isomerase-like protein